MSKTSTNALSWNTSHRMPSAGSSSLDVEYRDYFIRNLHDAPSGHSSNDVAEAVRYSEQSKTNVGPSSIKDTTPGTPAVRSNPPKRVGMFDVESPKRRIPAKGVAAGRSVRGAPGAGGDADAEGI